MESNLPLLIKIVHNALEWVKMVFCLDNDVKRVYDTKFAPPAVKESSWRPFYFPKLIVNGRKGTSNYKCRQYLKYLMKMVAVYLECLWYVSKPIQRISFYDFQANYSP